MEVTGSLGWYRRALGLIPDRPAGGALQALLTPTDREDTSGTKSLVDLIGPPVSEALDMRALDPVMARKIWEISTQLTRVEWPTT